MWTSLTYQRKMIQEVQGGWRPAIAQHRGSQAPMVEPMVVFETILNHQPAVPRVLRIHPRMTRFWNLGPRLPKWTLGHLMWTKSWWDGIVQLFMHLCELAMMKIGVLDGRDSLSNQHVVVRCLEWKPSSWIDSTPPCPSVSMQRAGKFGILANSCKDLDRSYFRRY